MTPLEPLRIGSQPPSDDLGEAGRLDLVEPDGAPGRQRFVDPTVHEDVLDLLTPSERVRLHARVAEAIGTIHAERIDAHDRGRGRDRTELRAAWQAGHRLHTARLAAQQVSRQADVCTTR